MNAAISPATETETSPLSPRLRGPRHLLQWLLATQPALGLHLLALDADRQIVSQQYWPMTESEGWPEGWPTRDESLAWVPVALAASRQESLDLKSELGHRPHIEALHPLDVLVSDCQRWWSAICTNEECCPDEGRELFEQVPAAPPSSIEDVAVAVAALQKWLRKEDAPADGPEIETTLSTLAQVQVRDAILVSLLDCDFRAAWIRKFENALKILECKGEQAAMAAALCIQASARFLEEDSEQTRMLTDFALAIASDYSYAKLLDKALTAGAPAALLISALESSRAETSTQITLSETKTKK